ncbi:MAG TPA: DUF3192 domain-containing protein, partial [Chlamydiales bacterium]|nr:DUF3192 domain-containing protein [Chlamydiales bacterium]
HGKGVMRVSFFSLVLSVLVSGCMPNCSLSTAGAAEVNVANLARIHRGMTQVEVLKIMRQPYEDSVFRMDNDIYDVWFYVTAPTALGQSRMVPLNLTPLTFKNGVLIGWGYSYYNYLKKMQIEGEINHENILNSSSNSLSASKNQKCIERPSSSAENEKVKKDEKIPLNEEDQEMLQEERAQDFNQS